MLRPSLDGRESRSTHFFLCETTMPRLTLPHGVTVADIASITKGTILGDPHIAIFGICSLDEPHATSVAFSKERSPSRLIAIMQRVSVGALIVSSPLPSFGDFHPPMPIIGVADPLAAIIAIIPRFFKTWEPMTTSFGNQVAIHDTALIGEGVTVGPFCSIGASCIIEDGVTIHPNVTIYPGVRIERGAVIHAGAIIREDCVIGPGAVIQNGAVIGSDGFGYVVIPDKGLVPVPQIGTVTIGAHVDVGANSCIDRGTLGTTRIGDVTKVDNLVQVGHNTTIGSQSIICGQAGIAGSCSIGDRVVLGGGVGVVDHVTIGTGVRVGGGAAVLNNISTPGDYIGTPAVPTREWFAQLRAMKRLLRRRDSRDDSPDPLPKIRDTSAS